MRSNALAVAAMIVVGLFVWIVTAWPAPGEDAALESFQPIAVEPVVRQPPPKQEEKPVAAAPPPAAPAAPPPQAAPAQPAAQEPAPQEPAPERMPEPFEKEQGPVAEYRSAYESEPRDSQAIVAEKMIRESFAPTDGAPDLLRSVVCRQTICKLELYWSPSRMGAYVAGVTRAMSKMERGIGVAPAGPLSADGARPLDVYLKRPKAGASPTADPFSESPPAASPPAASPPAASP